MQMKAIDVVVVPYLCCTTYLPLPVFPLPNEYSSKALVEPHESANERSKRCGVRDERDDDPQRGVDEGSQYEGRSSNGGSWSYARQSCVV